MTKITDTQFMNSINSLRSYMDILSEQESPFRTGSTLNTMDLSGNARTNQRKPVGAGGTKVNPYDATATKQPFSANDIPPGTPEKPDAAPFSANDIPAYPPADKGAEINPGTDATAAPGGQGTSLNQIQPVGDMPQVQAPAPIVPAATPAPLTSIQTTVPHKPLPPANPMVKQAQQGMIAAGLLPPGSDDGIMGPKTQAAYAKFSQQNPTTMNEHVTFGQDQELARIVHLSRPNR